MISTNFYLLSRTLEDIMLETISLILSIAASIGTIISLIFTYRVNKKIESFNSIKGKKNIQSSGISNINNTGDHNKFNL